MTDEDNAEAQREVADRFLLAAVSAVNYERIDLCLKKGADIDARDAQGRTPLMIAIWNEKPGLVEELLKKSPALFLKDNGGKSAFDLISDVQDAVKRDKITDAMLRALPDRALPDRARRGDAAVLEAAARAEAALRQDAAGPAPAPISPAAESTATAKDIRVPAPLTLAPRPDRKRFTL